MATLCALCRTVPFFSLPSRPPTERYYRIGDDRDLPALCGRRDGPAGPAADPFGFPWHEDMNALAMSASQYSCALCEVVHAGIQAWIQRYENAMKTRFYAEFADYRERDPVPTDQRLWLAKREGDAPGFVVLTSHAGGREVVYLLAGVAFSVEADNPLAKTILLRPSDSDSGSARSLDIAASFIHDCDENHEGCSRDDAPFPTRLLEISTTDDTLKLIDTAGRLGKYASLSYCWGKGKPFTSTRESDAEMRRGIDMNYLPKTFQDMLKVVRRLGIQYVWIDSLCIYQDDAEDWARESARMIEVYSNASLVIATVHASDSTVGLFHIRPDRASRVVDLAEDARDVRVQQIMPSDEMDWARDGFPSEPLTTRGWALQERLLARRLLHYTSRQVYYECDRGIVGEDGSATEQRYHASNRSAPDETSKPNSKAVHAAWNGLVWEYGRRKLTKPTDKLPGMSGIAGHYESKLNASYVAGLWSDNLMEGICWQGLGDNAPQSRDHYTGPSWSWASFAGIAATGLRSGWRDVAEILDWHVDLKTAANPYGEVNSAWLRIRGPMAPLKPAPKTDTDHDTKLRRAGQVPRPRLRTRYSEDDEGARISLDYEENEASEKWKEIDMQVMVMGGYLEETTDDQAVNIDDAKEPSFRSFYGLVVAGADDAGGEPPERMKRVGWTFLEPAEGRALNREITNWRTITLV